MFIVTFTFFDDEGRKLVCSSPSFSSAENIYCTIFNKSNWAVLGPGRQKLGIPLLESRGFSLALKKLK